MTEYLQPDEVKLLTDCTPVTKQDAWLTERGIPHQLDRKRVIVSREHVRAWLEGRPVVASNAPNLAALRRA